MWPNGQTTWRGFDGSANKCVLYAFHAKKSARSYLTGKVTYRTHSTPPRHETREFGAVHVTYTQERTPLSCKAPLCPLNFFPQLPAVRWLFLVWFLVAVLRARPEVMAPSDQNMGWWHSGLKQWPGGASQALGGGQHITAHAFGHRVLIFLF